MDSEFTEMRAEYTSAYESEARLNDAGASGPKCMKCGKPTFYRDKMTGKQMARPVNQGGCECPRYATRPLDIIEMDGPVHRQSREAANQTAILGGIFALIKAYVAKQGVDVAAIDVPSVQAAPVATANAPTGVGVVDAIRAKHELKAKAG